VRGIRQRSRRPRRGWTPTPADLGPVATGRAAAKGTVLQEHMLPKHIAGVAAALYCHLSPCQVGNPVVEIHAGTSPALSDAEVDRRTPEVALVGEVVGKKVLRGQRHHPVVLIDGGHREGAPRYNQVDGIAPIIPSRISPPRDGDGHRHPAPLAWTVKVAKMPPVYCPVPPTVVSRTMQSPGVSTQGSTLPVVSVRVPVPAPGTVAPEPTLKLMGVKAVEVTPAAE